jgi:hypothetical protein
MNQLCHLQFVRGFCDLAGRLQEVALDVVAGEPGADSIGQFMTVIYRQILIGVSNYFIPLHFMTVPFYL